MSRLDDLKRSYGDTLLTSIVLRMHGLEPRDETNLTIQDLMKTLVKEDHTQG